MTIYKNKQCHRWGGSLFYELYSCHRLRVSFLSPRVYRLLRNSFTWKKKKKSSINSEHQRWWELRLQLLWRAKKFLSVLCAAHGVRHSLHSCSVPATDIQTGVKICPCLPSNMKVLRKRRLRPLSHQCNQNVCLCVSGHQNHPSRMSVCLVTHSNI